MSPIAINGTGSIAGVTPGGVQSGPLVQGSAVATTSGTVVDVTGIPNWAKRVTLSFNGVSTNGANGMIVQLGAGSIETTGYTSTVVVITGVNTCSIGSATSGILINGSLAADARVGHLILTNSSGNTWIASSNILVSTAGAGCSAGSKTLAGVLDRLRVTTLAGTDTFDAGSITLLYE